MLVAAFCRFMQTVANLSFQEWANLSDVNGCHSNCAVCHFCPLVGRRFLFEDAAVLMKDAAVVSTLAGHFQVLQLGESCVHVASEHNPDIRNNDVMEAFPDTSKVPRG